MVGTKINMGKTCTPVESNYKLPSQMQHSLCRKLKSNDFSDAVATNDEYLASETWHGGLKAVLTLTREFYF